MPSGRLRKAVVLLAGVVIAATTRHAHGADDRLIAAAKAGDQVLLHTLIDAKADVDAAQPDGTTALAWAVYRDETAAVDLLLRAGADVNRANDYGVTPLWLACSNASGTIVARLLAAGASPNATLWSGETMLMACARAGSVEGVRALLERGADVNYRDPRRGQTALMWAAAARHAKVIGPLLARGADVHAQSQRRAPPQSSPMMFATWGRDVPAVSEGGFTALFFAAQQGDVESVRLLLDAGAKIDEIGPEGMTPLLMAAASGREDAALFLLERGARPDAADVSGFTALHYALREGMKLIHFLAEKPDVQEIHSNDPTVTAKLSQLVLVSSTKRPPSPMLPGQNMHRLARTLLDRGANPNAQFREIPPVLRLQRRAQVSLLGATPFVLASVVADMDAMQLLLSKGARLDIGTRPDERQLSEEGYSDDAQIQGNASALMLAAGLGREDEFSDEEERAALDAVKLQVSRGADVNEAGVTGWTALHAAAYAGADSLVSFLVAQGAMVDVQNGCGQTPLSLAIGENPRGLLKRTKVRTSTVTLLKSLGAGIAPVASPVGKCVEGRWGI